MPRDIRVEILSFYRAKKEHYPYEVEIEIHGRINPRLTAHHYRQIFRDSAFVSIPMRWENKVKWLFYTKREALEFLTYVNKNFKTMNVTRKFELDS